MSETKTRERLFAFNASQLAEFASQPKLLPLFIDYVALDPAATTLIAMAGARAALRQLDLFAQKDLVNKK